MSQMNKQKIYLYDIYICVNIYILMCVYKYVYLEGKGMKMGQTFWHVYGSHLN